MLFEEREKRKEEKKKSSMRERNNGMTGPLSEFAAPALFWLDAQRWLLSLRSCMWNTFKHFKAAWLVKAAWRVLRKHTEVLRQGTKYYTREHRSLSTEGWSLTGSWITEHVVGTQNTQLEHGTRSWITEHVVGTQNTQLQHGTRSRVTEHAVGARNT